MTPDAETTPARLPRGRIAPAWHTWVLIAFFAALALSGMRPERAGAPPPAVPFYSGAIAFEWLLFAYVWWGLRLGGNRLDLVMGAGRGGSPRLWRDVLAGLGFWAFWYAAESGVAAELSALGVSNAGATGTVFPHGALQGVLWIVLAASSGFAEEIAFRGYFQRQFSAWTGSAAAGIVLQAILFGAGHTYLGEKQVLLIAASGILLGLFAQWWRNLRPMMVAHAWADIFGGMIVRGLPYR